MSFGDLPEFEGERPLRSRCEWRPRYPRRWWRRLLERGSVRQPL